jgi:hypothetical protein
MRSTRPAQGVPPNLTGTLPAAQLSGTLPSSLLAGTYANAVTLNNAGNSLSGAGSGLTSLNASQLTSGTVPDARLSANVVLLNSSPVFSGSVSANGDLVGARLNVGSAHNLGAGGATIAGGTFNTNLAANAAIGGGFQNEIQGDLGFATISGGARNQVLSGAWAAAIGGGRDNAIAANATDAVIPGAEQNQVAGSWGLAAGRRAKANHPGAFVWADSTDADFASTATNQFNVRAAGGARFETAGAGMRLDGQPVFVGTNGSTLTALNASQLSSGTVPDARLSAKVSLLGPSIESAEITSLDAGKITSGTLADARLSANVSLLGSSIESAEITSLDAGKITSGTLADARLSANVSLLGPSIESAEITDGAVTSAKIADGTIVTADIASIDAGKIVGGDLLAARLKVGANHVLTGLWASIASGSNNAATALCAAIGGGTLNTNSGQYASIGGGYRNTTSNSCATVAGGSNNVAEGLYATVCGGIGNTASGRMATVGGGSTNTASGWRATVGGGELNTASQEHATVGGGFSNQATNNCATVPGGANSVAGGAYSCAAGRCAQALHPGSFVWADSNNADLTSANNNSVTVRASGGYRLFSNSGATVGVSLAAGGNAWSPMSDRNVKENFRSVDPRGILEKVVALPVTEWNLISQPAEIRHVGPMAQDFKAAFGLGEDDRHISTSDADGVALAAIQGLNQKLEETVKQKDARIAELERGMAELKTLVQALAEKVDGGGQ